MADAPNVSAGLFGSVRKLLDTGLSILQNRLELLQIELQEEKGRLIEILLLALATAVLGLMALLLVTATIIYCFWEIAPLAAFIGMSLFYVAGAASAFWMLRHRLKAHPPLAATLQELKKDRASLDHQSSGPS